MDKTDNIFEEGNMYVQRLLDRNLYSDGYSKTIRRRMSVLEALNKKPFNPPSNLHYDGNPFKKEFSQVNKTTLASTEDDQFEKSYVSTWLEDNVDLYSRKRSFESMDLNDTKATNRSATTECRLSNQFSQDNTDSDVKSFSDSANLRSSSRNEPTHPVGELLGPLTASELAMQTTLNAQHERELEQCNVKMQLQGIDGYFFNHRVIEICEPTIIPHHRKSSTSTIVQADEAELTYVKTSKNENNRKSQELESDVTPTDNSELFKELDCEMNKLDINDLSDGMSSPMNITFGNKVVSKKRSEDTIDKKDNSCKRDNSKLTSNCNKSLKNATFTYDVANDSQNPEQSVSKNTSFIKRHTSFLFKNLRTPKLRRRKSNIESKRVRTNNADSSNLPQTNTSTLVRHNTADSSNAEKSNARFLQQVRQVEANASPDVDDSMISEMEGFLEVALGNEQYNSTMVYSTHDSADLNRTILSDDGVYSNKKKKRRVIAPKSEPLKRSGTLNRTLSMYRSLTQMISDKFRRYDRNDTKSDLSTFFQQNTNSDVLSTLSQKKTAPEDWSPELREIIEKLQEKVAVQDTLIYQASKALQLCSSMREFTDSPERVEYERLLLLASLTRKAISREIDRLSSQQVYNNNEECSYNERGEVTLKDIRLQLREDMLRRERQNGDVVEWFVVVVIHGMTVWATRAIACPISSPQIYFPGQHIISGLTPDFRLSIKVYSMKLQQLQLFNHDDKYHITRNFTFSSSNTIKTPKPHRRKSFSPKQYKVKFTGIKETSFTFCGAVDLTLYDLKLVSPWPLNSLSSNSVLHGTVDLNLSCKLELSMFHGGFVTHCEESGDLAWSRRWCLLEGHTLLFWNYPREQEYNPPMYIIDLVDCISSSIGLIDRKLCPRPKTLLLETRSKAKHNDLFIIDGRSTAPIHRHLLSYDSHEELSEWRLKLNRVVTALTEWNIIHPEPVS
ncbi:anillin-like isoform X2 [Phymastichus coffea]|uniref:anillin-like isoform X2 n=1 Tax=Phymastichus coffea TaxID=108790 RepID=UPI00273B2260|nr:anillin-like isoform X2 [Phymastichus coffea]